MFVYFTIAVLLWVHFLTADISQGGVAARFMYVWLGGKSNDSIVYNIFSSQ